MFAPSNDGYFYRHVSIDVSRSGKISIVDNMCQKRFVTVPSREFDYFFFGAGTESGFPVSYDWIGIRKISSVNIHSVVYHEQERVLEVLCPDYSPGPEVSLFFSTGLEEDSNTKTKLSFHSFAPPKITSFTPDVLRTEGGDTIIVSGEGIPETDFGINIVVGKTIESCSRTDQSSFTCLTPEFGSDVGYPEKFAGNQSLLLSFDGQIYLRETSFNSTIIKPSSCYHLAGDSFDYLSTSSSGTSAGIPPKNLFKHGWLNIEGGAVSSLCASRSALIFNGEEPGVREAATRDFDSRCGGEVRFSLVIGEWGTCRKPLLRGAILLQSSLDGGVLQR